LPVVDQAEQRTVFGDLGQHVEHGQPDQEPVWRSPAAQPERHTQGGLLRPRKRTSVVEQRCAQLVQAGERELRLRLCADRVLHAEAGRHRGLAHVLEQRTLADAGFAANDQGATAPGTRVGDQLVKGLALRAPAEEVRQLRSSAESSCVRRRHPRSSLPRTSALMSQFSRCTPGGHDGDTYGPSTDATAPPPPVRGWRHRRQPDQQTWLDIRQPRHRRTR
jgi:hypothetical protein